MINPTSAALPQPAVTLPNSPAGAPATQDLFMEYLLSAASESAASESASASTASAPAAPAPAIATAPQIAAAPATSLPSPAVSSSAPYFTPDPDQYATVTPTNGMSAYQVDSTSSYQQKFIASMVSDMSGFIDGTHSWANGGADAITQQFIAQAQQRIAAYPTGNDGDPVALGTKDANTLIQVLSSVSAASVGATNFSGSVLDYLTAGGAQAPTAMNQAIVTNFSAS